MKKHLQFAVAVLGTVLVTGCGFHLRSSPSLPDDINTVAIESARAHAPLARALDKRLNVYGLTSVSVDKTSRSNQNVNIYLLPEKLERQLLHPSPERNLYSTQLTAGGALYCSIKSMAVAYASTTSMARATML